MFVFNMRNWGGELNKTHSGLCLLPSPLTGSSTVWAAQLHSVLMQILKAITHEETSLMHKDLKSFELKECFYPVYVDLHFPNLPNFFT